MTNMHVQTIEKESGVRIVDPLWAPQGEYLDNPELVRLLRSAAVQRLGSIGQNGASNYMDTPLSTSPPTTSRLDHSVGVFLLTRFAGGTVQEQICALLHDLPHTAFSHTFDHLFEDPTISYHEPQEFIAQTICRRIARHLRS